MSCGQSGDTLPVTWSDLTLEVEEAEEGLETADEDSHCGVMPACDNAGEAPIVNLPCAVVTGGECVDGCCTEGLCGLGITCQFFDDVGIACPGMCDENDCCVIEEDDLVDGEIPPIEVPPTDPPPDGFLSEGEEGDDIPDEIPPTELP
jgi:hypothetical protein